MKTEETIYVKALSNGQWFGGWAPVRARCEWLRDDDSVGLFTLLEQDLDEDDEYEFFRAGSLLLAARHADGFKVLAGADAAALGEIGGPAPG